MEGMGGNEGRRLGREGGRLGREGGGEREREREKEREGGYVDRIRNSNTGESSLKTVTRQMKL